MKKAILLVAYGIGSMEGRRVLGELNERVRNVYPDCSVRWAYSSPVIRQRLAQSRFKSDSVEKALLRLWFERFDTVVVQPLQTIPGREHETLLSQVQKALAEKVFSVAVGEPLLSSFFDVERAADSLVQAMPGDREADEDVIFMGHGTRHPAEAYYEALHASVQARNPYVHVGTMEGRCNLTALLPCLHPGRVWLMPLLSTVGRHTLQDMAGRHHGSWRSRLEEAGHVCVPVLKGTAEQNALVEIWLDHLRTAAGTVF